MDKRTAYILDKIGRSIPKEMLRRGVKTTTDAEGVEMRERVEYLAKKGNVAAREFLRKDDVLGGTRKEVDETVSKEIEDYVGAKVNQAISSGLISEPKKDDFMRMVEKKLEK